jgi:glycosyltransferase involved in cell wall biosynthesis
MRLDPACRAALGVLWRQLGPDAVEALFGRPLLTLDRRCLAEITGSPFWHNVLRPLDAPAGVPALFDTAFYVAQPNLDLQQLTPLGHYVLIGTGEGRNPHPLFNTAWYLSRNPDVVAGGTNPLLHFVTTGGPEGRQPHSAVPGSWYRATYDDSVLSIKARPLPEPLPMGQRRYNIRENAAAAHEDPPALQRPIVCVSHVLPSRPRAGNEYRISRLLEWLGRRGHKLIVIVAPQENEEPGAAERQILFEKYPNALICCRDGTVFVSAGTLGRLVAPVQGQRIRDVIAKLPASTSEGPLTALERNFCHDGLVALLAAIGSELPNAVYYINYAFMTRFLPYLSPDRISFVDTHDVLSDKSAKVVRFGVSDNVSISAAEEGAMLQRANAVLAIQRNDAAKLATMTPHTPVLTVGVDFAAPDVGRAPEQPTVLMVAHNNPLNIKGAQDFLRFAWPFVKAGRPETRFVVVGSVAQAIRYPDPQVLFAGVVDDLAPYYAGARVVVNPAVAGTGLKIKTVESIAYARPIVTFPSGVEGIAESLLNMCYVASDWYDFAEKVMALLDAASDALAPNRRQIIENLLAPSTVYKELDGWLAGLDRSAAA